MKLIRHITSGEDANVKKGLSRPCVREKRHLNVFIRELRRMLGVCAEMTSQNNKKNYF